MLIDQYRAATVAEVVPVIGRDYYPIINWLIMQATASVFITVFQGTTSETNKHHRVRKLLLTIANKAAHGVDCRMLLYRGSRGDKIGAINELFAKSAATRGIKVYFAKPGDFIHCKLVIVDRKFVLLGSHNMTVSGLWDNYEASILVESANMAEIYNQYFKWMWDRGKAFEEVVKSG
jgi:hypothetical protein